MKYNSPFHLLPERDINVLTAADLKRWKKELLLQFDLQGSTTIQVKGKEYDKNSILQAFDLLQDRPDYHWRLFRNKPLLEFIEDGYIDFFNDKENWLEFGDIPYQNWLAQWFMPQYDDTIFEIAEAEKPQISEIFETLVKAEFRLPEEWQYQALTKTYRFFSNLIASAYDALEYGLLHGKKIDLPPQIHQYVDEYYWNILKFLPENFEGMRAEYAELMYATIRSIFDQERRYKDLGKQTLETLEIASEITYQYYRDEYSRELNADIKAHLIQEDKHWTSPSKWSGWVVYLVFVFFVGILSNISSNDDDQFNTHIIPYEQSDNSYAKTNQQTQIPNNAEIFALTTQVWHANFMISKYANVEKTLKFNYNSTGKASIKIPGKKEGDFCTVTADFEWIKNGDRISIYYEIFNVTGEFRYSDDELEALKKGIITKYTETLSTDNPFNTYGLVTLQNEEVRYYKKTSLE